MSIKRKRGEEVGEKLFKKIIVAAMIFTLPLIVAGCQSIQGYPDRTIPVVGKWGEKGEIDDLVQYFKDPVMATYNGKTGIEKKSYRDEVVHGRLRAIDLQFEIFEKSLQLEKNTQRLLTDFAVLGLSGAGTLAGGAPTKAILAAISGGLTGADLSVNENLYYKKTISVLFSQMEAMRSTQLVKIYTGLKQDTAEYPLSRALYDVDTYYKVGTIPGALVGINAAAGAKQEEANKNIVSLLIETSYVKDNAGDLIRKYLKKSDGSINEENEKNLKKWLKDHGHDENDITLFIISKDTAEDRKKIVNDLKLQ